MWISGDYTNGVSVLDRLASRALETKKVAEAADLWLDELEVGTSGYNEIPIPTEGFGIGLTEAPRGGLGHWVNIQNGKIDSYQVITPTSWNASPKDDFEQPGPIEQALIGVEVKDFQQPIEVLRVIHSFDPCLACAVHLVRPDKDKAEVVVHTRPSI
jgi:hydrogenase large subunit